MHQLLQILSVGKPCDRITQYSLYGLSFLVSKMEEYYTRRKRSSNEGYLRVLPKKKPKPEPEENKFMFMVLLLNGLNLTLQLEDVSWKDVSRRVCKGCQEKIWEINIEKGLRKIHYGPQVYVEDAMGEQIMMETSYAMILTTSPCLLLCKFIFELPPPKVYIK